jgi:AraC-like DNA-binding protein
MPPNVGAAATTPDTTDTPNGHLQKSAMSAVPGSVIRRIVQVSSSPVSCDDLLASVGLSPDGAAPDSLHEFVTEDAYYDLLERATVAGDLGLPFRYASAIHVDDFGALGLALKTATTLREALLRMTRYILVLSDTVEYELRDVVGGSELVLDRPSHRRGARLANECALAADVALLRQITDSRATPVAVSFQHPGPRSTEHHRAFFGCPVRFDDGVNALHLSDETLDTRTRLADEGLSAFILATLDDMKQAKTERPLPSQVHSAVTDSLPDGRPTKPEIARRLGMSPRTLGRRLADHGETYQAIVKRAQRDAAESLLRSGNSSLAEVAFLTGFSDQSAFTRAFKGWTGQTPTTFRASAST